MKKIIVLSLLLTFVFSGCDSDSEKEVSLKEKKEYTIINGEKVEVVYLKGFEKDDSSTNKNDKTTGLSTQATACNESTRNSKQFFYDWWCSNGILVKIAIEYNKTRGQTITWSPYLLSPPQTAANQAYWVKRTYLEYSSKAPCRNPFQSTNTSATTVNMSNYTILPRSTANASGLTSYYVAIKLQSSVNGRISNSPLLVLQP